MFLDGDSVDTIEFHGHCSTSAQGVAADIIWGEAELLQAQLLHSMFDDRVYLGWGDLQGKSRGCVIGTDSCVLVSGICHDMGHPSSQGLNWASDSSRAVVADALATFAILLVGYAQCCMCCCAEFSQWGCIGDDRLVGSTEDNVFDAKALGAGAVFGGFVGVLTHP